MFVVTDVVESKEMNLLAKARSTRREHFKLDNVFQHISYQSWKTRPKQIFKIYQFFVYVEMPFIVLLNCFENMRGKERHPSLGC